MTGRFHSHVWQLRIRRDYLGFGGPPYRSRGPSPTTGTPALVSSAGDRWRFLESQVFLLRNLHMDLLKITYSKLQCWGRSPRSARDIQGGTELSGFRAIAREAAFSHTEVLAEATVPLLSPSPLSIQMLAGTKSGYPSNSPYPRDYLRTHTTQIAHRPTALTAGVPPVWRVLTSAVDFLKVSERPQTPNEQ